MAKELRQGLVYPDNIPSDDIVSYMATTYQGYMKIIRQRFNIVFVRRWESFGYTEFDKEFVALHGRMICELLSFAIADFCQIDHGLIAKSNKTENDPEKIFKLIKGPISWPKPVYITPDFSWDDGSAESIMRNKEVTIADHKALKKMEGIFGSVLHEKWRPRHVDNEKQTLEYIWEKFDELNHLVRTHYIANHNGNGWLVDTTRHDDEILMCYISGVEQI